MSKYTIKKINNEDIKIIPVPKVEPKEIKGYNVLPALHCNTYICGQKGTGKTNVIYKIIESCIDSNTRVIVFCSTHNNDVAWVFIKKYLEKNNIPTMFFSSLFEDKVDQLETLLDFMRAEGKHDLEEEEQKKTKVSNQIEIVRFDSKMIKIKIKKPKQQVPKYLIIFDDLSIELKKKNVPYLLKTFRHFDSKVIVSSQFLNDLDPQARQQIDFWILFKNHPEERLESLYPDIGCNIDFDKFYDIYKYVTTSGNHQFLFVDKNTCEFRINFDKQIQL